MCPVATWNGVHHQRGCRGAHEAGLVKTQRRHTTCATGGTRDACGASIAVT